MTVCLVATLMIAAGFFLAGFVWGRWTLGRSVTLFAGRADSTPHRIEGRFYYLVPESEYVRLRFGYQRDLDRRGKIPRADQGPGGHDRAEDRRPPVAPDL